MTGVEFNDGINGGGKMESVFMGVLHIGVEVLKLGLNLPGCNVDEFGEGLHYLGVVSGPFREMGPAVV